jgi:hypothetical protein
MALPFDLVNTADLASGSIVEDLKLGLDLALAGSAPMFCPSALVTSEFARQQLLRESSASAGNAATYL